MKFVFLSIFFISTAVHLYASLKENASLRNKSKPFMLISLLLFYVLAARSVSVFIVLALLFSWIGDLLLIPKGNRWFTAGGIAFMISHAFFIAGYRKDIDFSRISVPLMVFFAVFFIAAATFLFIKIKPYLPKALLYPMYLYLLINGAMNCFADFRGISMASWPGVITAIGAALFFLSDAALFFVRFKKDCRLKTHFLVMLTYSVGELMIVLGVL